MRPRAAGLVTLAFAALVTSGDAHALQIELAAQAREPLRILNPGHRLPANPVIYLELPGGRLTELPTFATPDGTLVAAKVEPARLPDSNIWRAQVEIDHGTLVVTAKLRGIRTFVIDPAMHPTTRKAQLIDHWNGGELRDAPLLDIDSDAALYLVQCGTEPAQIERAPFLELCGSGARVTALYPDGSQAQVFEYRPATAAITTAARAAFVAIALASVLVLLLVLLA